MSTIIQPSDGDPAQLHCPHCHSPIDRAATEEEIVCESCGSSFQLDPDRTQLWSKDVLPELGKFQLLETIGRGAFGTVYRARDTQLDRIVAVKVPRSGQLSTAEDEDRLVREARNAAQLQHPGIVPVYEVGHGDSFPYIVCEYVQGVTLADTLTARKFSFRESAGLVAQVAVALAHAHTHGVVHRDLKPSNIMLTPEGTARVMDFGLSKRETGDVTVTMEGQVLGTPAYMSPEQASGQGHQVDGRSDVYGMGAILYELLTGELPFRGNQRMILNQVMHNEPRAPRSLNDRIPHDLETICIKAMAKEPARRYQTAQALADDLTRWLNGQPIQARPVGRMERGWRLCRRNPIVASLCAAVALALLAGTGVSAIFAIEARARASETLAEKIRADAKATEAEQEREKAVASQQLEAQQRRRAEQAEEQATEDARRATVEAEKAQQVAGFLARLFEESAPLEMAGLRLGVTDKAMAGANLTAREMLDRGAQRITIELVDQPVVQAALKEVIGNVYLGIGMMDKADALLQEALELRQQNLPREHVDIASSLHSIGVLRFAQGRPGESAPAFEEALAMRRRLLGEDHELVDTSRMALGALLAFITPRGKSDELEAIQLCRQTLAWRRKRFGDSHPKTAIAMCSLAGALLYTDQQESALLILEATPILENDPLTRSLGVAMIELEQAEILKRVGQREMVTASTRRALEAAREVADDGHPLLLFVKIWSVDNFLFGLQYDEAEAICREWLAETKRLDRNPSFIDTYLSAQLARVLLKKSAGTQDARSLDEVESLYQACLAGVQNEKAYTMRITVQYIMQLAGEVGARKLTIGRFTEAEQAFRESVRLAEQMSSTNPERMKTWTNAGRLGLADALAAQGKVQEAEAIFRALVANGDDIQIAHAYNSLAKMSRARGDEARAIAILKEHIESTQKKLLLKREASRGRKIDVTAYARAVIGLREAHYVRGEIDEAFALLQESLPLTRDHIDASYTLEWLFRLGYAKRERPSEGELFFRESLKLAEGYNSPQYGTYWLHELRLHLGNCLAAQGKNVEAEELLRKVIELGNADQIDLAHTSLSLLLYRQGKSDKTAAFAKERLLATRSAAESQLEATKGGKADLNVFASALMKAVYVLQAFGMDEEAGALIRESVSLIGAHSNHSCSVHMTVVLADLKRVRGNIGEALTLYKEALQLNQPLYQEVPGYAQVFEARLKCRIADCQVANTELAEAEELYRQAAESRIDEWACYGEEQVINLMHSRGADDEAKKRSRTAMDTYRSAGLYELWAHEWRIHYSLLKKQNASEDAIAASVTEANEVLLEARNRLGTRHVAVGTIVLCLGEALCDAGQFAQAEENLREAVRIRLNYLQTNDSRHALAQVALGQCLVGLAKFDEAESVLTAGCSNLVLGYGPLHENSLNAANQLVRLYDAWQRPEQAQRYRKLMGATQ